MKNFRILSVLILGIAFIFISCGPSTKVTRVSTDTQIDLSGRWNDTDSQMVAQEMIRDALNRPWITNFVSANNRNPVSIIIPCHRVIGSDGKLVGYGGGLPVKEALLKLEGSLFLPV